MNQLTYSPFIIATILLFISLLFVQKKEYRWIPLLFISLLFYWWISGPKVIILLLYGTWIFYAGIFIYKKRKQTGNAIMSIIISFCLLPLVISKLLPLLPAWRDHIFFASRIEYYHGSSPAEIAGISYFIFNAISYVVDVRRGYLPACRNYFRLLLYLSFYPVVYSGPLHRAKNLLQQFIASIHISVENCRLSFRLLLLGLFKNLVLAQRILSITSQLEDNSTGLFVILQGFCFFFYLYCSFSSYVDIARGLGKIVGIDIANNFRNRVYASSSRQQFWQGWHITLNNWFRDYVFFPLAKKKRTAGWMKTSILITFILIGLWHGISVEFALWGMLNGCWILAEQQWGAKLGFISVKYRKYAGIIYHLFIASFLALLFSSSGVMETVDRLFSATAAGPLLPGKAIFKEALICAGIFFAMDWLYRKAGTQQIEIYIGNQKTIFRWIVYIIIITILLLFGQDWAFNNYYFKF
jgi:alginate O-acetyltransferase complex protein AlgI